MAGYALVEAVKAKKGISSDNQLANLLGIDRQNISNWKNKEKARPEGEPLLDLMILGEISPSEAKRLLQSGFASVSLLIVTGLGATLAIGSDLVRLVCILCKIDYVQCRNVSTRKDLADYGSFRRLGKVC
jgi:hypothetical protein